MSEKYTTFAGRGGRGGGGTRTCRFFGTASGCRNGDSCAFQHLAREEEQTSSSSYSSGNINHKNYEGSNRNKCACNKLNSLDHLVTNFLLSSSSSSSFSSSSKSNNNNNSKNVTSSAYNITTCLSMLAEGCKGQTRQELCNLFGFSLPGLQKEEEEEEEETTTKTIILPEPSRSFFLNSIQNKNNSVIRSAQALLLLNGENKKKNAIIINENYIRSTRDNYHALIKSCDGSAEEAVKQVNRFCDKATEGEINQVLQPGDISEADILVLVSCLLVDAKWKTGFEVSRTGLRSFFITEGKQEQEEPKEIRVQTMHSDKMKCRSSRNRKTGLNAASFDFAQKDDLTLVVYWNEQTQKLPDSSESQNLISFEELLSNTPEREHIVFLPKFKVKSQLDLKELLSQNNCGKMFSPAAGASGDFSNILVDPDRAKNVCVTKVVHACTFTAQETGIKAAAATVVVMGRGGRARPAVAPPPPPMELRVDSPFLFYVVSKKSYGNLIVFSGAVSDPTK